MNVVGLLGIGCLVGLGAVAWAAEGAAPVRMAQTAPPPAASAPAPSTAAAPQQATPAGDPAPQPAASQQAGSQPAPPVARTREERRRLRTYARCNRAAYARSLHGGARRRFLIRCRLGYERGIGQPPPIQQQMRKP